MNGGAHFSDCRQYRYTLWRNWDPLRSYVAFIGLNPSTADETENDPTIRRCITYAQDWGYGSMFMLNLFAWRATDPKAMKRAVDPIGEANDYWLHQAWQRCTLTVAAWGTHGAYRKRAVAVRALLPNLHVLRLTKAGFPSHPLYLPKLLTPIPW